MTDQRSEVLIQVRDDALIVANGGRPVSRLGVLSLCASDLTEKSGHKDEQPEDYPDTPDEELLKAIAKRTIDIYRIDSNRRTRDVRREKGVSADYGGRYLWELIQNADDALAPDDTDATELIGTKGLGFISVLEITDRPEIFSHPFVFYFSHRASEALLRTHIAKEVRAPTFEIPHPAVATPEIAQILQRGYASAIRLPFRDAKTAAKVRAAVERLDHRFLLLSQHIKRLQIDVGGRRRTIDVSRSSNAPGIEEIVLSTEDRGAHVDDRRWTKWFHQWEHQGEDQRLSVAVCLPNGAEGEPHALAEEDKPAIHVFFPTDEAIGARAIVHASLEVTQNRKHFRAGERNALVYPQMRKLVATILAQIPAEVALDAFGGVDPKNATGGARELASTVSKAITDTPFVPTIGGEKVRPRDVKVWNGRFGTVLRPEAPELRSYRLLHPSVSGRNAILKDLEAKELATNEFFGAMRYCKNRSWTDCKSAAEVLVHEGLPLAGWQPLPDWFAQVPCWWTEDDTARPLAGRILLFKRPPEWPKFIDADALSREARRHLAAIEALLSADAKRKHQPNILKEYVVRKFVHEDEYLVRALLPVMSAMKPEAWEEHGWDVLRWYREWSPDRKFDDISSLPIIGDLELDGEDAFRRRLSRALRLPTDKNWQPAEQCYADRTWGAPRSFRPYFRNVDNRAVVRPLRTWREPFRREADPESWKGLLRFAGVSWEPKLVTANYGHVTGEYIRQHLSGFNRRDFDVRIEHFPDCLATERRLLPLLDVGRALLATAEEYPAKYLLPNKQKSQTLKTNFAKHQLGEAEWLPHRKSLLFPKDAVAATNAYLAGKGIEGLLPEIAVPEVEARQKNELLRFLKAIGINEALPTDGLAWVDWMRRLADAAQQPDAEKGTLLEVAKTLYRKFFNLGIGDVYGGPRLRVPCFVGGETPEHLTFVAAREAKWLDQPIFEAPDIRRELLAHGYRLFIMFLNQADGADRHLEVQRLSESVSLSPISAGVDEEGTTVTLTHYRSRLRSLRAVIPEVQRPLLSEELRIEATPHLSISIRAEDGKEITAASVRAFRNQHGTLLVASDRTYNRALGMGLAHYVVGNPKHSAIFETILSANDDDEVIERLRDQGIPAQELDAVKEAMARERSGGAPAPLSKSHEEDLESATAEAIPPSQPITAPLHMPPQQLPQPSPGATAPAGGAAAPPSMPRPVGVSAGQTTVRVERLGTGTWATRGGGGWDPAVIAEAGQHAEDWLYARLTAVFSGRQIVRRQRDALNRESDFVIHFGQRTIHIEAKRVGSVPGFVYWSDLEFAKGGELRDDYCMAILLPSSAGYDIAWIWEPAAQLVNAERFVDWIWDGRRSDQLPDGSWQPTSPAPHSPPRSFTYRITLDGKLLGSFPKDTPDLVLLQNKIAAAPASVQAATGA